MLHNLKLNIDKLRGGRDDFLAFIPKYCNYGEFLLLQCKTSRRRHFLFSRRQMIQKIVDHAPIKKLKMKVSIQQFGIFQSTVNGQAESFVVSPLIIWKFTFRCAFPVELLDKKTLRNRPYSSRMQANYSLGNNIMLKKIFTYASPAYNFSVMLKSLKFFTK